MNIIAAIFLKHFFPNGNNFFACCWQDGQIFFVQLGTKCKKYKTKKNALKALEKYLVATDEAFQD